MLIDRKIDYSNIFFLLLCDLIYIFHRVILSKSEEIFFIEIIHSKYILTRTEREFDHCRCQFALRNRLRNMVCQCSNYLQQYILVAHIHIYNFLWNQIAVFLTARVSKRLPLCLSAFNRRITLFLHRIKICEFKRIPKLLSMISLIKYT